jgi:hypothetical protein
MPESFGFLRAVNAFSFATSCHAVVAQGQDLTMSVMCKCVACRVGNPGRRICFAK